MSVDNDTLLYKLRQYFIDKTFVYFGRPMMLERYLKSCRVNYPRLSDRGIAASHSISWDKWPSVSDHYRNGTLQYWIDSGRGHRAHEVKIPEIPNLVIHNDVAWRGRIRDVKGVSNSKSKLESFETLDALAMDDKLPYLKDLNIDQIKTNLSHWTFVDGCYRVPEGDFFFSRSWSRNDLYLANTDGSHRFAAARLLAGVLGEDIEIAGPLDRYEIDIRAAQSLMEQYEIFLLTDSEMYCGIIDAAKSFGVDYGIYGAPMTLNPQNSWDRSHTLFIKPENQRCETFIRYLRAAGIFSLNAHLMEALHLQTSRPAFNQEPVGPRPDGVPAGRHIALKA